MERAGHCLVIALFSLVFLTQGLIRPARADCAEEVRNIRAQLAAVTDERRRSEAQLLLEKAEKEDRAGRPQLCGQAVEHARAVLK
jgi:hypothetical protein